MKKLARIRHPEGERGGVVGPGGCGQQPQYLPITSSRSLTPVVSNQQDCRIAGAKQTMGKMRENSALFSVTDSDSHHFAKDDYSALGSLLTLLFLKSVNGIF